MDELVRYKNHCKRVDIVQLLDEYGTEEYRKKKNLKLNYFTTSSHEFFPRSL